MWIFAKSGGEDWTLPSTTQRGMLLPSGSGGKSSKEHMAYLLLHNKNLISYNN